MGSLQIAVTLCMEGFMRPELAPLVSTANMGGSVPAWVVMPGGLPSLLLLLSLHHEHERLHCNAGAGHGQPSSPA
jgi:hypothetical protein